jgi:cell division protein FtsQ
MKGVFRKGKPASSIGPRQNQWKGSRMGEGMSRQAEAKRARTIAKRIVLMRWSGLIVGVALLGWIIVMGIQLSGPWLLQLLEIKQVTVDGVRHLDRQEVIELVNLKPGTPLHHIVTSAIKERVESHPWIKEATVERVPLHELHISIRERTPAAVIRAGSEIVLSDAEGHVLGRLPQADDVSLPMVTGVDLKKLLRGDEEVRQAVVSGIELTKLMGQVYGGRLQVNAANPADLVASVRGVQFHFGEGAVGDQWERFQQVKPAVKTLSLDGYGDGVNDVDLRYENRIVVRERG